MKAREFLARTGRPIELRNLIKEPLTIDEIEALARAVGGVEALVAPKRRTQAAGLSRSELVAWLAADGSRLRRPIVVAGKKITLGFDAAARAELEAALR